MKVFNHVDFEEWQEIADKCEYATFFHTSAWAKIIEQSFPNNSIATKAFIFDDGVKAILPLIQSKRFFRLRKSYVSMVPGVYGGIISNKKLIPEQVSEIYKYIAKKCSYLMIVGNPYFEQDMPVFFHTNILSTRVLDLENGFEDIWKNYSKSHKRYIRKAQESGVCYRVAKSLDDYSEYFRVYEDSLKRWGINATSAYDFNLFENIFNSNSEDIKLHLAIVDEKIVSGILTLHHRNHVVYWHGATLKDYFRYSPSKYLQNEVIKDSCEKGYKYYDFNPSGGHQGVIKFKEGFGAEKITFKKYTLKKMCGYDAVEIMDIKTILKEILPERILLFLNNNAILWNKDCRNRWLFGHFGIKFTPNLKTFPPMVMIDTTTRCNFSCAGCPHSILVQDKNFRRDMDVNLYKRIIDEISEYPGTIVRPFDGGEPLMRKDMPKLISYAKQKGIKYVSINTNGSLLNMKKRCELIEAGLDHIEVSIDAATSETYSKIRRQPSEVFENVVKNTIVYKEDLKTLESNGKISVSFVLQKENAHELEKFKSFWKDKVDFVAIRPFHQHNKLIHENNRAIKSNIRRRHPCPYLWDRLIIQHDGRVRFCEADWKAEHAISNVKERSIKEIWNGKEYAELRESHVNGNFDHPFCSACTDWREVHW